MDLAEGYCRHFLHYCFNDSLLFLMFQLGAQQFSSHRMFKQSAPELFTHDEVLLQLQDSVYRYHILRTHVSHAIEKFGALSYSKIDNKFSIVNPFININGTDIPSLINESNRFRVLGKQYPTNVCDSLQVSNFVKNKVESMITHVNNQTILPAMKAKIIELCFPQFLRWFLQVHEISITFYRGRNITVVDKKLLRAG
ncbi:hypothetical protein RCL1_007941 [Eukaryota sp. TZLM3-RCL]